MQIAKIVQQLKKSKHEKNMTMNEIAEKSKIGIRTVNRVFAGQDVKFSTVIAILDALDLYIHIDSNVAK